MKKSEFLRIDTNNMTDYPLMPESVMVSNLEDLHEKLNVGAEQIRNGKVVDADVVMNRLKVEYGF